MDSVLSDILIEKVFHLGVLGMLGLVQTLEIHHNLQNRQSNPSDLD